jgi:hypothetical protein
MGKDATKPFKKKHNERILKTSQYEGLCIGKLIEEGGEEGAIEQKAPAPPKFGRFLSWRKRSTAIVTQVSIPMFSFCSTLRTEVI